MVNSIYLSSSDHNIIFARFTASGVVRADVMFNAPFTRILAVRTFYTAVQKQIYHMPGKHTSCEKLYKSYC